MRGSKMIEDKVNILMKTTDLIQHGYRVIDYTREGILFENDKLPNFNYKIFEEISGITKSDFKKKGV
jgi:hypothetical protein